MRIFLFVCLLLLILILAVLAAYLILGSVLYRLILSRKGKMAKETPSENDFFKDYATLEVLSEDKLKLKAKYKDNKSYKLALLLHGYGGSHKDMTQYIELFEKLGYDILSIDMRCHGESEGQNITMGREESKDLILWINKMLEIKPDYKIALFGLSLGASSVCMTLGENLPKNVILAIEDSGFDNANKELKYIFSKHNFILKSTYKIFYNYTKKSAELDLKKVDVLSSLKKSKIPILFIHGDSDKTVPVEMVYNMSAQIPDTRKRVFIGKDSGHIEALEENRQEYTSCIKSFLSKYNMA